MKVLFVSLGCDKNTVDSQMMLGILSDAGHIITYREDEAEAVVINTCAFINDAKQESINTILEMAQLKKTGKVKAIVVTGCLAQRYKEEITENIPEVDAVLGIQSFDRVAEVLKKAWEGEKSYIFDKLDEPAICGKKRILTGATHYAYLKIAEGCNKHCTYCIIPSLRGKYRSVPKEVLIKEANELANKGVKELIVVAQETTVYGTDIYGKKCLPELLHELAQIEGIENIRLLYCYPEEIDDELILTIKNEPKVCNYLDIPIQHASDRILKRMGRKTSEEDIRTLVNKLRREIPDIAIRTTLISGFPGETHRDYVCVKKFVSDMRFDRLGVFTYSAEEGTGAAKMKHQVPGFVKKMRRNGIMKLQQRIAFENARAAVSDEYDVTIEGRLLDDGVYVGRTYKDAPDVDGYVFVTSDRDLMSGDRIRVKITDARGYDLCGEEIEETEE